MSQSDQENQSTARWWEFYAIRYGMGSVVGGIIFFFLCNSNPVLKKMLFGAEGGKIDGTLLALLLGYGLAYCYIASAPILVLHAGRFLLNANAFSKPAKHRIAITLGPPLLVALIVASLSFSSGIEYLLYALITLVAAVIIWPQYLAISFTILESEKLLKFYKDLSNKRSAAKGGLIDSYKHLREHGNSFFIVLLEILLASILYFAGNFNPSGTIVKSDEAYVLPYLAIILIWIIPAACVWLVGTLLERRFSDDPTP